MAVTPVGNPYVESSDLVANYPGASEALAERIDIVGVNPFADAAARATAIPSPVEGQMASLNDDDQLYRYSGSAWVAVGLPPGLNPVAPTSIANSGGSASTTSNTTNFTSITSLSLNGLFTATYNIYRIVMPYSGTSAGASVRFRLRVSGTDSAASSYDYASMYQSSSGGGPTTGLTESGATSWPLTYTNNNAGQRGSLILDICEPQSTQFTNLIGASMNTYILTLGARFTATTQFDGLTIYPEAGNISGKITVYGYKD